MGSIDGIGRALLSGSLAGLLGTAGGCDSQPPQAGPARAQPSAAGPAETVNQRLARQKHFVPAINRHVLPAPEGPEREVAQEAITKAESKCDRLVSARRFDSDGSIVAGCANGREFRIFNVEGLLDSMSLDCSTARRIIGVDPCDKAAIEQGTDDSIEQVLASLGRIK